MTTLQQSTIAVQEAGIDRVLESAGRTLDVVHATLQIAGLTIDVDEVGVGYARTEIPSLIRASARTGKAFHIRNAKNPDAPSALLVSPEALARIVSVRVQRRTLGELLQSLPFKHIDTPRVRVNVPNNLMRPLRVPVMADLQAIEPGTAL